MNISEIIAKAQKKLSNSDESVLSIEILLAYVLGITREELFLNDKRVITKNEEKSFNDLFNRFFQGEPIAYIIGKKEFYGLDFIVNKDVLIPRPETEMLVEKVVEFVGQNFSSDSKCKILDVGTGCGAIAIALAKKIDAASITATDISKEAISVAKENAIFNKVDGKIQFKEGDLLNAVDSSFDVVVANLPYIGEDRFNFVAKETYDYEPHIALFGGNDGLVLYRRLFKQLKRLDWNPKLLLGEFGFLQGDEMRNVLNKNFDQCHWQIEKDYALIERIFMVTST